MESRIRFCSKGPHVHMARTVKQLKMGNVNAAETICIGGLISLNQVRTIMEGRSCHGTEWSENILCGGRHLIIWRPPHN